MKKILDFDIYFPVVRFSILVSYFTKRKPTAFEDIILKSVGKLKNDKNRSTLALKDFLEDYLMIPDSKHFINPTLDSLKVHRLISYQDDLKFEELLIKDIKITEDGRSMQIRGFLPSDDLEDKILAYWNPVTDQILNNLNNDFDLDSITESIPVTLEDLNAKNVFPEQSIRESILSGFLMPKFKKGREELRQIENVEIEREVRFKKVRFQALLDNQLQIQIASTDTKSAEKYNAAIKPLASKKTLSIIEKCLGDYGKEDPNSAIFSGNLEDIGSFLKINNLNKIFQKNTKIKIFGYIDEISELISQNLGFDNEKARLKVVYAPQYDNRIVFDKTNLNCTVYLNKKNPIEQCVYWDDQNNNVLKANFTCSYNEVTLTTSQYYNLVKFHDKFDISSHINNIEAVISESDQIDNCLIKLYWLSEADVWQEIFAQLMQPFEDLKNIDACVSLLERLIHYGQLIAKHKKGFSYSKDLNGSLNRCVDKLKSPFDMEELKSLSEFVKKHDKIFQGIQITGSMIIEKYLLEVTEDTLTNLNKLLNKISVIDVGEKAATKLLGYVESKIPLINNNNRVEELKNIVKITNNPIFNNHGSFIVEKILLPYLSQQYPINDFADLHSLYSVLKKSNLGKTIIESEEHIKSIFAIYDGAFMDNNFLNQLKDRSKIEDTFKILKQTNLKLSKKFGYSTQEIDLLKISNEANIRHKIIQSKSINKLLITVKEWQENYKLIERYVPKASNISKIDENVKELYQILQTYITDIPNEYENVYVVDSNAYIGKYNILETFNYEKDFILLPKKVFDELDGLKKKIPEAQKAIKCINDYLKYPNISIEESNPNLLPDDYDKKDPDNLILSVALKYKQASPTLLTSDINCNNKAFGEKINVLSLNEYISSKQRRK